MTQQEVAILARIMDNLLRIVGLSLLSGLLAALLAVGYRWYARMQVPTGLSMLVGLTGVALVLNLDTTLASLLEPTGGADDVFATPTIVVNTLTLAVSGVTATAGGRVGDRIAGTTGALSGGGGANVDVSAVVKAVGRVITVELPEDIEDMDGHDPVAANVKERIAGLTLVFPRRLTVEELRNRLVARLREEYGVGVVDVDIEADGTVTYLAVGSREIGLGTTLPPETCAVAIRADPAFSASAGDVVHIYDTTGEESKRVAVGEVRGTAGEVVTVAVDADDATRLNSTQRYRLATLPVEPRVDREFASLLRAADETVTTITLAADSPLVGQTVGALNATVIAVHGQAGTEPLVPNTRTLTAGETLYVIAKPDAVRRLEAAATGADTD